VQNAILSLVHPILYQSMLRDTLQLMKETDSIADDMDGYFVAAVLRRAHPNYASRGYALQDGFRITNKRRH